MSPAALRALVRHQLLTEGEATRFAASAPARRRPLRPLRDALPALLAALEACMGDDDDALVARCIAFLDAEQAAVAGDRRRSTPRSLLSDLGWTLLEEDDAEGCIVTAQLFAALDPLESGNLAADMATPQFLARVAARYADATRYLRPLLTDYARRAVALAGRHDLSEYMLFLRDGLTFWPALRAAVERLPTTTHLHHLIYTRPLRESHGTPLVARRRGAALEVVPLARVARTMLLDVGLYGTLVRSLHDDGYLVEGNKVFFVGSRNPAIDALLDLHTPDGALTQRAGVALVDTIECLLKAFQIVTTVGDQGQELWLRLGDPISFVCAARFMRDLYASGASETSHSGEPGAWYLDAPIPAWTGAESFIASWAVASCLPPEPR